MPGEFEGEVRLDAGVDLARPAVVDVPAAVGKLPPADVPHAFFLQHRVHLAPPVHVEHVVGAKRAVDNQLAHPVAFGGLEAKEVVLRPLDGDLHVLVIDRHLLSIDG